MATTANYSWSTPDNTSYVKDGAQSIRTLGSSVDTTLFTALGGAYPGLRLVKKQTIGSAVASIVVSDAFSATYENYKIIISGGASSATTYFSLKLGSANTQYYQARQTLNYAANTTNFGTDNNSSQWTIVGALLGAGGIAGSFELINPFSAKYTGLNAQDMRDDFGGTAIGVQRQTNSYTGFTITPASGTITGGTIYVYGYGIS
jgi:hypothetical protein